MKQEILQAGFEQFIDYDLTLEKAVLGIFLLEPYSYSQVHGLLSEDCFYSNTHKAVYLTVRNMWTLGMQIDLVSVCRRMYDKGHKVTDDMQNTGYYLGCLTMDVVQSAHLQQWCLMLRELAVRREMLRITRQGIGDDDPLTASARIQKQIEQALSVNSTNDWIDASVAAVRLMEHMDNVKGKTVGLQTGIGLIDKVNGGFRGGQLIILAARPAIGKSALMGEWGQNFAKAGTPVGIVSLEMPAKDVFGRMVSGDTGVSYLDIDHNRMEEYQRDKVVQSINKLSSLPIYFSDTAKTTILDIRAKAEMLKQKHGIKALFIDYLQLVEESSKNGRNRENAIGEISRGLKMIAMNMDIPVIALSQLNRDCEKREDKRPRKSDLRESGSLEQDADVVMLLHRPFAMGITQDEHGNSTENKAELLVEKWRNGSPMVVELNFHPETMKFSDKQEPKNFEHYNPKAGISNRNHYETDNETPF